MVRSGYVFLAALLGIAASATAAPALPATANRLVLDRLPSGGYHWKLSQVPLSPPGDGQVLLRVRAISLNRGDLEILDPGDPKDHSGLIVASDAAGEVVAVGPHVSDAHVGERVTSLYFRNWTAGPPSREHQADALGANVDGVAGDYVLLQATSIAPMPAGLTYEEAATLPTAGLTGWMATQGHRSIGKTDVVVVQGTGGVSTFALQFAAALGARVIVTSSSDEKIQRAKALGARDGINYRAVPDWSRKIYELTQDHGADLIVEVGGSKTMAQSAQSLAFLGTLSIVGGLTGYDAQIPAGLLLMKTARAQGILVGSRADYARMNAFITSHHLRPVIDRVFSFDDYESALKYMAADSFVGKIVLKL